MVYVGLVGLRLVRPISTGATFSTGTMLSLAITSKRKTLSAIGFRFASEGLRYLTIYKAREGQCSCLSRNRSNLPNISSQVLRVVVAWCGSEKQALANADVLVFEAMREQATLQSSRLVSLVKDRHVERRKPSHPL